MTINLRIAFDPKPGIDDGVARLRAKMTELLGRSCSCFSYVGSEQVSAEFTISDSTLIPRIPVIAGLSLYELAFKFPQGTQRPKRTGKRPRNQVSPKGQWQIAYQPKDSGTYLYGRILNPDLDPTLMPRFLQLVAQQVDEIVQPVAEPSA